MQGDKNCNNSVAPLLRQTLKSESLQKFSYKDNETLVESECLSVRWLLT
jgi:hypothetical protein